MLPANSADHDFRVLRGLKGLTVTAFKLLQICVLNKQLNFFKTVNKHFNHFNLMNFFVMVQFLTVPLVSMEDGRRLHKGISSSKLLSLSAAAANCVTVYGTVMGSGTFIIIIYYYYYYYAIASLSLCCRFSISSLR